MKKIPLLLSLLSLGSVLFTSCTGGQESHSYITYEEEDVYKLNYENIDISLDGTFQLILSLNGFAIDAEWSSSNDNVSVVDGLVTGQKIGNSVVTATYDDKTYSCNINVVISETLPSLKANCNDVLFLNQGDSYTIVCSYYWNNIESPVDNISYVLSSGDITASVKENNVLIKAGKTSGEYNMNIYSYWHEIPLYLDITINVK